MNNSNDNRSRSKPPYNPGVRDLVEGKTKWSSKVNPDDQKRGFKGWHERGYLPHRDEPGLKQFVTFRLCDSFHESKRSGWESFREIQDPKVRRTRIEDYLDKGHGECFLRRPEIAELVESNILKFRGERYSLLAWAIMPSHVHVLFETGSVSMAESVGAWKRHTSRLANRLLGREGTFWGENYYDTYIRDAEHEQQIIRYIEGNPCRAKLVLNPTDWSWSSARFRDEYGTLKLPGRS